MFRPRLAIASSVLPLAVAALAIPAHAADKKGKDAPAAAAPKYNLSKGAQPALLAAQDAIAKKDYATATAKLAEADALLQTPDDHLIAAKFHLNVAAGQNDAAGEAKAIATLLALPNISADDRIHYLNVQAQLADAAGDATTERAALTALAQAVPDDPNTWLLMGDMDSKQKNYAQALADTEKGVALLQQANKPIDPALPHNLYAFAHNAHNAPAMIKYGSALIAAQPTAANWELVIDDQMSSAHLDDDGLLDLYRLKVSAGAMEGPSDWAEYADLARSAGLPGETLAVLDQAKQKGVHLNAATDADERKWANQYVSADKSGLPAKEAPARAAKTGDLAQGLANGYFEYGDYAKAADFYQVALEKGGGKVNAQANQMRLGIALARAGQKDQAKAAFAKVTGPRQPLASLWTLYVDHPAAA